MCLLSFLFSTSLLRYQCIRGCKFLGTLTLKQTVQPPSVLLPWVRCQDWVLFLPSPLRSAGVAQPWSSSRGPPLRCTEESFRESVSTLEYWGHALAFVGWRDQQSGPLLHPPPPCLLPADSKAVDLESGRIPQQRPQAFQKAGSGLDCLSFLCKLRHGFIPKHSNDKSRPLVCPWLNSLKHHAH